ncbi:hypothetical protein V8C42DRAFT_312549 [Trichoderma barbatum]
MPCAPSVSEATEGPANHLTESLKSGAPTPSDPPLISRLSTLLPGCWPLIVGSSSFLLHAVFACDRKNRGETHACLVRAGKGALVPVFVSCSICFYLCVQVSLSHRPSCRCKVAVRFASLGQRSSRPPLIHLDSTSDPDRPLFSFFFC